MLRGNVSFTNQNSQEESQAPGGSRRGGEVDGGIHGHPSQPTVSVVTALEGGRGAGVQNDDSVCHTGLPTNDTQGWQNSTFGTRV